MWEKLLGLMRLEDFDDDEGLMAKIWEKATYWVNHSVELLICFCRKGFMR